MSFSGESMRNRTDYKTERQRQTDRQTDGWADGNPGILNDVTSHQYVSLYHSASCRRR